MNPAQNGFYVPGPPPMMNPPPRLFGSGQFDPSQMPSGPMYAHDDYDDHGDQSDPKRRRIARVHIPATHGETLLTGCRRATCAGRKRSSATARCPRVHTARTTRQNASSRRWKRRGSRPRGELGPIVTQHGADRNSAKYIEGLENRLARMESLMRLSGVLPDDDDGSTDLATLERRLADRAGQSATPRNSASEDMRASVAPTMAGTPVQPALPSPRSGTASPEPEKETNGDRKEEDALAEMMCSLVTNNCGETRYIGPSRLVAVCSSADFYRVVVGILHLLTQGYPVGQ
jgi:hypothetical protein